MTQLARCLFHEPGEVLAMSVDVVFDVVRADQLFMFLHPEHS